METDKPPWSERVANLSLRQLLGFALIVLATLAYVLLLLVPFLDVETAMKGAIAGGIVVFAEAGYFLATLLLGKEIVNAIKGWWKSLWSRDKKGDEPES